MSSDTHNKCRGLASNDGRTHTKNNDLQQLLISFLSDKGAISKGAIRGPIRGQLRN